MVGFDTTKSNTNNAYITDSPSLASDWLKQGKILAYPSESVWGIGCDAFCESAVSALLALKNRPINKGLIVLSDSIDRLVPLFDDLPMAQKQQILDKLNQCNNATNHLSIAQAQTWLVPVNGIPKFLIGEHQKLAVRMTPHWLLKQLCYHLIDEQNPYGFLVSTSCNWANHPPATSFEEAYRYFGDKVAYLKGETLGFNKPSKINDIITGEVIRF